MQYRFTLALDQNRRAVLILDRWRHKRRWDRRSEPDEARVVPLVDQHQERGLTNCSHLSVKLFGGQLDRLASNAAVAGNVTRIAIGHSVGILSTLCHIGAQATMLQACLEIMIFDSYLFPIDEGSLPSSTARHLGTKDRPATERPVNEASVLLLGFSVARRVFGEDKRSSRVVKSPMHSAEMGVAALLFSATRLLGLCTSHPRSTSYGPRFSCCISLDFKSFPKSRLSDASSELSVVRVFGTVEGLI